MVELHATSPKIALHIPVNGNNGRNGFDSKTPSKPTRMVSASEAVAIFERLLRSDKNL